MKKFFRRLIPVMSLLCMPLFGGYAPNPSPEGLRPDERQLTSITRGMIYQSGAVTRQYEITIMGTAPRDGINDVGELVDYRFFSILTNFRRNSINNQAVVFLTSKGQEFINTIRPFPQYTKSTTYPGYGRFWFNAGKTKVHNIYGRRGFRDPWPDSIYIQAVNRDMQVRASGVPIPGLAANPAGW